MKILSNKKYNELIKKYEEEINWRDKDIEYLETRVKHLKDKQIKKLGDIVKAYEIVILCDGVHTHLYRNNKEEKGVRGINFSHYAMETPELSIDIY